MLCAATDAGLEPESFVDMADLFSAEDLMGFVLSVDGWTGLEIQVESGVARVDGTVPRPVRFAIIGVLGNHGAGDVHTLRCGAGPRMRRRPTIDSASGGGGSVRTEVVLVLDAAEEPSCLHPGGEDPEPPE